MMSRARNKYIETLRKIIKLRVLRREHIDNSSHIDYDESKRYAHYLLSRATPRLITR